MYIQSSIKFLALALLAASVNASPAESLNLGIRSFATHGSMDAHPAGHFRMGRDGILRSYGPNNAVLDYRHLTSAEVMSQAKRDIEFLEARDLPVDLATRELAERGADSTLVTARDAVLEMRAPPKKAAAPKSGKCKRALNMPVRRGLDSLLVARQNCPTNPIPGCACLQDCPAGCNSCYFPNGPGNPGHCMYRR